MWLIVYKEGAGWDGETEENRVFAVENAAPPDGAYGITKFDIKEWDGPTPKLPDYDEQGNLIPGDVDPTLSDPEYADKVQERLDYETMRDDLANELEYLDEKIPTIDGMTFEEVRAAFKRSEKRWRQLLKALKYLMKRRIK